MNTRRHLKTTISAAMCCLLLTGCSSLSLSGQDILVPPRAEGHHAEVQSLLEECSEGSYTLMYPSGGDYKSAVIFRDVDHDGEEEAVAMYRDSGGTAHTLFIRNSDSGYTAVGNEQFGDSSAEHVDFADLDGDGAEEFIIKYPGGVSSLSSLSVIRIGDSVKRVDLPSCCHEFVTGDVSGDGVTDILTLTCRSTVSTATAGLLAYKPAELKVSAVCSLDEAISSFARVSVCKLGSNAKGAVIDGRTADGEYTTQVLYYDSAAKALLNPLLSTDYQATRRSTAVMSADVDRDGIFEIPICSLYEHSAKEDASTVCRRVSWNSFSVSDLSLSTKKTAVLCEDLGFMFNISDDRVGSVTARRDSKGSVTVYVWEYRSGELCCTDRLLTIKYYPKEEYNSSRILEAVLGETGTGVYTYTIGASGTYLSYTDKEVVEGFVLTDSNYYSDDQ